MLLEVKGLTKTYGTKRLPVRALSNVDLRLAEGGILGVVGESGCGKTTLLKVLSGLEAADDGEIKCCDSVLGHRRSKTEYRMMQMIFQDAVASFNPRRTIRASIRDALKCAAENGGEEDEAKLCGMVGLSEELLDRRPGQLSGGQCQRFAIARAVAVKPKILLCDEATSALDVSAQAQILKLLSGICRSTKTAAIFVSHDLAVVSSLCDRIMVMKSGCVMEEGTAAELIKTPKDEYTKKLIESVMEIPDEK
ncbi:MAG: ABC transporter ATP-binding protein [Lachnospiraceae bacterium]|nr:ABC transporter ATP-binding protein [Lachnospiraceae bacterium]